MVAMRFALITQLDRFAAAINISGKVIYQFFLGDSPKLEPRKLMQAAENGQDRIGGLALGNGAFKYIATVRITLPNFESNSSLDLTGEGDWNVPGTIPESSIMPMRRLGKEVLW